MTSLTRTVQTMSVGRITSIVALFGVALVGCSGDDGSERIAELEGKATALESRVGALEVERDELQVERDALRADVEATSRSLDESDAKLAEAVESLEVAEADLKSAEEERDDALADAALAQADLDQIRIRFDPEIQAAVAAAQQLVSDTACAQGDAFGFDPSTDAPDIDAIVSEALIGLPEGIEIDRAAVQARVDECVSAGQVRLAEAALVLPKGDGLWTVGLEIAAGRWRSAGTGDSCYWQRSPDGSPDDIIDNHFGNAGGTVTLRMGEEFETTRCGTWEFVS